jgi:hypothetical protein
MDKLAVSPQGRSAFIPLTVLAYPRCLPEAMSFPYRISTTKTSPRQLVPTVQVLEPDSDPSVPIQSEENTKNLPSCETLPIAYWVLKFCELAVIKLCANRQMVPLPSAANAIISSYHGAVKGPEGIHVVEAIGKLSAASALFHDWCWSKYPERPVGKVWVRGVIVAVSANARVIWLESGVLLLLIQWLCPSVQWPSQEPLAPQAITLVVPISQKYGSAEQLDEVHDCRAITSQFPSFESFTL